MSLYRWPAVLRSICYKNIKGQKATVRKKNAKACENFVKINRQKLVIEKVENRVTVIRAKVS